MPANVEWGINFQLQPHSSDPTTELVLNAFMAQNTEPDSIEGGYLLDGTKCSCGYNLRVTTDDRPQDDGVIFHRRYRSGYFFNLAIELWRTPEQEACEDADGSLRKMNDQMMRIINEFIRTEDGRILWDPSDYSDQRMMDRAQLAVAAVAELDSGVTVYTVGFDSPFPYVIDKTEQSTSVSAGTTGTTITNNGTMQQSPVIRVNGPVSSFTIMNEDELDDDGDPLAIIYDDSLPGGVAIGGGDYLEIDCFKQTAYLNGNQANRKAGIDLENSDFFHILRGPNQIVSDVAATVLWNHTWA